MEEKIKQIVSKYIKKPIDQIASETMLDRTAVSSSILLHRMYANLSEEGITVPDYWSVRTYGDLLSRLGGSTPAAISKSVGASSLVQNVQVQDAESYVGIDIVELSEMPIATNFRENEFYKMNFTKNEIAYCVLKADPIASFAGLFAAKEAIVKIDDSLKSIPFHLLEIDHLPSGKPVHSKYDLSISHSSKSAIAVAFNHSLIRKAENTTQVQNLQQSSTKISNLFYLIVFGILLLLLFFVVNR